MKEKLVAKNIGHLRTLIEKEIAFSGSFCDLNHIDVSNITDMAGLFNELKFDGNISEWDVSQVESMSFMFNKCWFDGDISKWNVSKVTNMSHMFWLSHFNQDISAWNVSNVRNMNSMFYQAEFDGDISKWDVSSVIDITEMFYDSKFSGDLSNWKPYLLEEEDSAFMYSHTKEPYWIGYSNIDERNELISKYHDFLNLKNELPENFKVEKKIKI